MPIGTPHGTLDYKQVSKVTFVGASSNTVIDTTTGSLGVGVGVGGPTSNLHVVGNAFISSDLTVSGNVSDLNVVSNVNMLHTANTASIKLNSNVVTEFPRSKKLIKYPRVALTSAAQSSAGDYEGYIVNQSSVYTSESDHGAYLAFRGNSHWLSSSNSFDGAPDRFNDVNGPWISIQLPTKIKLEYLEFSAASGRLGQLITAGSVYASNNGSTWINIGSLDNLGTYTNFVPAHVDFTHTTLYDRYLLHVTANATNYVHMEKLSLFGIPEYDPEAHGTDVTVKSYPNVPNTDWLEVYYDAKNYTSGVVQDLSTNSFNGTLTNGVSFNNSDGIDKFVFDGSNDYISGSVSSTFTGDQPYTFSTWIKPDSHPSGFIGVFGIGTNSANDSIGLFLDSGNIIHLTYANNLATTTYATIGEWVHITGTYDGTGRTIFVNGKLIGTDSYSSLTLAGTTFRLGSNLSGGQNFNGSITNFRLFNRALTTDEIYQLYAYQKEYFGHGDLSMTLKAGRLGIGTSEPSVALDVKGDTFSTLYKGGRTTFLTWDYVGQRYVDIAAIANATSYANVANVLDHTFDIPSCYHGLGTANLKAFVQIDWRGEVHWPWNFGFRIEVTYNGTQIAYSSSSDHAASWNSRVCGVVSDSYHNDFYSTPDFASVTSQYTLNNCDVSPGSTLKVQLVGHHGDTAGTNRVWTGRTNGNANQADYELPTTSFFVVLDVDDGY